MDVKELKLRQGSPEDMAEMQKLYVDTIKNICINDYNQEQIAIWTSSVENTIRWLNIFEKQHVIIAEYREMIVGYCTLDAGGYLDLFYVHKDFQRKGIANKLLLEVEQRAVELNYDVLTANVSITAKPFFEKNGFTVVKEQENVIKGLVIVNYNMAKML